MLEKPKWLQNVAEFLIDNFTILLTIGFAFFVIYRQAMTTLAFTTNELLTTILAVLGLLATSEITERYRRLKSIQVGNRRILLLLEGRFTDRASSLVFFRKTPNLDSYMEVANKIDLCGVSLTATVNKQLSNLRERLNDGASIRVLIADPNSLAPKMSAARSGISPAEYFHKRLEATLNDLKYVYDSQLEPRPTDPTRRGSFSVRLMPFTPSFGILSLDPNRPNGTVFIELYPHYKYGIQPAFDLTFHRDGEWYNYFINQFEQMWTNAIPWVPANSSKAEEG